MYLTIVAPSGMLCHTTVEKVTLPGILGSFTVLSGHAPLVSQLTEGKIRYTAGNKEYEQEIRGGFAKVEKDVVEVCVELVLPDSSK